MGCPTLRQQRLASTQGGGAPVQQLNLISAQHGRHRACDDTRHYFAPIWRGNGYSTCYSGSASYSLVLSGVVVQRRGVGPVFLVPTATDALLCGGKWGAGPTAVVLKQSHGWTVGALANHVWSFAGDSDRGDISWTFLQPFVSYTTKDAWTFTLNTENTYNWEAEEWSVPVNFQVAKLVVVDKQPISLFAGVRYWAQSPDSGPDGWAFAPESHFCSRRNEKTGAACRRELTKRIVKHRNSITHRMTKEYGKC